MLAKLIITALCIVTLILMLFLAVGAITLKILEDSCWSDCICSASAILRGKDSVVTATTCKSKAFVSVFSLFGSLTFVAIFGVVIAKLSSK